MKVERIWGQEENKNRDKWNWFNIHDKNEGRPEEWRQDKVRERDIKFQGVTSHNNLHYQTGKLKSKLCMQNVCWNTCTCIHQKQWLCSLPHPQTRHFIDIKQFLYLATWCACHYKFSVNTIPLTFASFQHVTLNQRYINQLLQQMRTEDDMLFF